MHTRGQGGFTLIEVVIVLALIGVLATMASVVSSRMARQNEMTKAALVVAGALRTAQERAIHEGTNYLVFFRDEDSCADGRDPILDVVRDVDGSMTISAGDQTTPVALPDELGCEITSFDPASGLFPGLTLPVEDLVHLAAQGLPKLPPVAPSGPGGGGSSGCASSSKSIASVALNGASFAPSGGGAGDPVIVFTSRGVPVHPDTPSEWGSGAGGYYLTNGKDKVVAILVAPSGRIRVRTFRPESGRWI